MKQRVVQAGGDTLLLGGVPLQELNIHRAQENAERFQAAFRAAVERGEQSPRSAFIVDPVINAVQLPEGETWFNGAALKCG